MIYSSDSIALKRIKLLLSLRLEFYSLNGSREFHEQVHHLDFLGTSRHYLDNLVLLR